MTKIEFTAMTDLRQQEEILSMMRALYAEDEAASPVAQSRFSANVEFLVAHPSRGRIVLFNEGGSACGYALVVPYWSNESGVRCCSSTKCSLCPTRNRGIGRSFFNYLGEERPFEAVALALEVRPSNKVACRLYESLGFRPSQNSTLTLRFGGSGQDKGV